MNTLEANTISPEVISPSKKAEKLSTQIGLSWGVLGEDFKEMFIKMNSWGHLEGSMDMNQLGAQVMKDPYVVLLCKNEPDALRDVLQGSTLSDIGKRGPAQATKDQSELIVRVFKINHNQIEDSENMLVYSFVFSHLNNLETNMGEKEIRKSLEACGITPNMTLREFYNLHVKWSLEILDREPAISQKVKDIVARHHTLEGANIIPGGLTLEDRVVVLLDKYDARRKRAKKTHQEAIAWIQEKLQKSVFCDDAEFKALLKVLERVAPSIDAYK